MSKKQKNIKRTEAIRRTRDSDKLLSDLGLNCADNLQSIGIVLEHAGLSQLSMYVLETIAQLTQKYAGLDISLFVQKIVPPIAPIACPHFPIKDLIGWNNPVITTNISTTLDALYSKCPTIYHYVFDLDFLYDSHVSKQDMANCFVSKNVTVFTRSDWYKNIIEQEFSISIMDTIIPDFNIANIAQMIFRRTSNDCPIEIK